MKADADNGGAGRVRLDPCDEVLIEWLVDRLTGDDTIVREEIVAAAKARLADGDQPPADVVAGSLVDGLIACRAY